MKLENRMLELCREQWDNMARLGSAYSTQVQKDVSITVWRYYNESNCEMLTLD